MNAIIHTVADAGVVLSELWLSLQANVAARTAIFVCNVIHHSSCADCVRYVSDHPVAAAVLKGTMLDQDWRTLCALTAGWIMADRVGQLGDAEAAGVAPGLAVEAQALQRRLNAPDQRLCGLLNMSLDLLRARTHALSVE